MTMCINIPRVSPENLCPYLKFTPYFPPIFHHVPSFLCVGDRGDYSCAVENGDTEFETSDNMSSKEGCVPKDTSVVKWEPGLMTLTICEGGLVRAHTV
jgi:hypothetical protein